MTQYDPFSYGQVPIGQKEPAAPDDMLFSNAAPVKAAPPAEDSDWTLPTDDRASAFGGSPVAKSGEDVLAFGADILGEKVPEVQAAKSAPKARPATAPRPATTAAAPGSMPVQAAARAQRVGVPAATAGEPAATAAAAGGAATAGASAPVAKVVAIRKNAPLLMPRRSTLSGLLVPVVVLSGGGGVASWLYMMQQNPVMAAIVAATSMVGAALARVLLRG
jgi:hypothetical protein